jgi:hypothetical protein
MKGKDMPLNEPERTEYLHALYRATAAKGYAYDPQLDRWVTWHDIDEQRHLSSELYYYRVPGDIDATPDKPLMKFRRSAVQLGAAEVGTTTSCPAPSARQHWPPIPRTDSPPSVIVHTDADHGEWLEVISRSVDYFTTKPEPLPCTAKYVKWRKKAEANAVARGYYFESRNGGWIKKGFYGVTGSDDDEAPYVGSDSHDAPVDSPGESGSDSDSETDVGSDSVGSSSGEDAESRIIPDEVSASVAAACARSKAVEALCAEYKTAFNRPMPDAMLIQLQTDQTGAADASVKSVIALAHSAKSHKKGAVTVLTAPAEPEVVDAPVAATTHQVPKSARDSSRKARAKPVGAGAISIDHAAGTFYCDNTSPDERFSSDITGRRPLCTELACYPFPEHKDVLSLYPYNQVVYTQLDPRMLLAKINLAGRKSVKMLNRTKPGPLFSNEVRWCVVRSQRLLDSSPIPVSTSLLWCLYYSIWSEQQMAETLSCNNDEWEKKCSVIERTVMQVLCMNHFERRLFIAILRHSYETAGYESKFDSIFKNLMLYYSPTFFDSMPEAKRSGRPFVADKRNADDESEEDEILPAAKRTQKK